MLKTLKGLEAKSLSKEESFEVIRNYILDQRDLALRKMLDQDTFETPAWSEFQAHQMGLIKALDKLLTFIPDKGKNV